MKKFCDSLNGKLCIAEKWTMIVMFVIVMIVMTIQIIMRYVFNNPLVWSEEFSRFGYVWITWIGCAYCAGYDDHIRISVIYDKLPEKIKPACIYLGNIIVLVVMIYLIPKSLEYVIREHRFLSGTMQVPMSILYSALTVGCVLTAIQIVLTTISRALTPKEA